MRLLCMLLLLAALLAGCSEEATGPSDESEQATGPSDEYVQVQFDLQVCFAGNRVTVWVNGERRFDAMLSGASPLAGPEASFVTCVTRGTNQVEVGWSPPEEWRSYQQDDETLEIGDAEQYFVGLNICGGSLSLEVQDSPFGYAKPSSGKGPLRVR